jgi:hypothetical protein
MHLRVNDQHDGLLFRVLSILSLLPSPRRRVTGLAAY